MHSKYSDIYHLLEREFDIKESSGGWLRITNPFDHKSKSKKDKSMGIHLEYGAVVCHRTGYRASIQYFLKEYLDLSWKELSIYFDDELSYRRKPDVIERTETKLPSGVKGLTENSHWCNLARKYLQSRNIDVDYVDILGVLVGTKDDWAGYLIVPFHRKGKLLYYLGRSFVGNKHKHKNMTKGLKSYGKSDLLYNEDALQIYPKVQLVEGIVDAWSIGESAVARMGWSLSETQKRLILNSPVKTLEVVPDKGFYKDTKKEMRPLIYKKKVLVADLDNMGEEHETDVNDWGWDNISHLYKDLQPLKPWNLV